MGGAGITSYAGDFIREQMGDYRLAFLTAALLGFIAVALAMGIILAQCVAMVEV